MKCSGIVASNNNPTGPVTESPLPNGGVLTCKNMMKKGTGVKGGVLIAKSWILQKRSLGVFLGEGEGEGIYSTRMELIRRPKCSLKDESRFSSVE